MTAAEIVPADNMAVVATMTSEQQALAVTNMLTEARSWLAHAVEATDPAGIVQFKAQMATVAEATKQLGLSKEIQEDAAEMVRRAERGVGTAIRTGQNAGTIARERDGGGRPRLGSAPPERASKPNATEILNATSKREPTEIYAMADATDEQFDAAIDAAKSEGNLSRANVVRKVREQTGRASTPRRRPLTDSFRDAAYDLNKVVERLQRLVEDDRYPQNAEQVAASCRGDLLRAAEALAGVLDRVSRP